MFYLSSFFDGFWFLIRSTTRNPLKLGRRYEMVIFAPSNRAMVSNLWKNLPPKKSSLLKKVERKSPCYGLYPTSIDWIDSLLRKELIFPAERRFTDIVRHPNRYYNNDFIKFKHILFTFYHHHMEMPHDGQ